MFMITVFIPYVFIKCTDNDCHDEV